MDKKIKRWTARRKSVLVLQIIQGKTSTTEASRQFDPTPSEIVDCPRNSGGVHKSTRSDATCVKAISCQEFARVL